MMSLNELFLNDFHTATIGDVYATIFLLVFLGFLLAIVIIATFHIDLTDRYRKGQIDALNGKVKYEKRENDDGEMVWVKKEYIN